LLKFWCLESSIRDRLLSSVVEVVASWSSFLEVNGEHSMLDVFIMPSGRISAE
jgi:hypothetical protein